MESRLTLRQRTVPFIIAVLLGLQFKDPSRVYIILLVAFGGIFLVAWIWAYWLSREIKLLRETRVNWVQVGGHIEEKLTLSNTSFFPAPHVEFNDHSTLPDFDANRVSSISAGGIDQWTVTAFCRRRGMFQLGDAEIKTGDPFGIFDITIHASLYAPILVLPQAVPLPEFNITSSGMLGEGQPRRNSPQQTMHASTVREFAEGDSLKLVHWPTTARMHKTFVRLMESAPEGNWWIILDLNLQDMFGTDWDSTEEQSVSVAASLADLGLRERKSVGLLSNGAELTWLPPQRGETQHWEILQALAKAKPGTLSLGVITEVTVRLYPVQEAMSAAVCAFDSIDGCTQTVIQTMQALAKAKPGTLSLAKLLDKMQTSLGSHHSLLIITTCTQVDWIKSLPSLLKRGLLPTVLLMDPTTFDGGGSLEAVVSALAAQNIQYHIIPRGLIEPPKMDPRSPFNKWAGRVTPMGPVIPIKSS